ncbi:MAG: DNA cytosine methyltransferase [Bacteroidales bacterium]|nr:DNA cytosine methyltransferase [Bacteroidales bacterium]
MRILSFFCGCGGLDLGFRNAGYQIVWANDNAHSVKESYEYNFPDTTFCDSNINTLSLNDIPNGAIGIIGGPPCQSWSNAGKGGGFDDPRGKVFLTFINILKEKRPLFFVAENVKGLLAARNSNSFEQIKEAFKEAGYDVWVECLNANDFDVPQNRERVIFVGFRKGLNVNYRFPMPLSHKPTVQEAIQDLQDTVVPMGGLPVINAHEYWEGGYSYIFMSRNRVLDWNKPSFTIQASGRQTSIHPSAPKMIKVMKDVFMFDPEGLNLYRRLSARECARIQTFPDNFVFKYQVLNDAYKMIGNAVPVNLAYHVALSIRNVIVSLPANFLQQYQVNI